MMLSNHGHILDPRWGRVNKKQQMAKAARGLSRPATGRLFDKALCQ